MVANRLDCCAKESKVMRSVRDARNVLGVTVAKKIFRGADPEACLRRRALSDTQLVVIEEVKPAAVLGLRAHWPRLMARTVTSRAPVPGKLPRSKEDWCGKAPKDIANVWEEINLNMAPVTAINGTQTEPCVFLDFNAESEAQIEASLEDPPKQLPALLEAEWPILRPSTETKAAPEPGMFLATVDEGWGRASKVAARVFVLRNKTTFPRDITSTWEAVQPLQVRDLIALEETHKVAVKAVAAILQTMLGDAVCPKLLPRSDTLIAPEDTRFTRNRELTWGTESNEKAEVAVARSGRNGTVAAMGAATDHPRDTFTVMAESDTHIDCVWAETPNLFVAVRCAKWPPRAVPMMVTEVELVIPAFDRTTLHGCARASKDTASESDDRKAPKVVVAVIQAERAKPCDVFTRTFVTDTQYETLFAVIPRRWLQLSEDRCPYDLPKSVTDTDPVFAKFVGGLPYWFAKPSKEREVDRDATQRRAPVATNARHTVSPKQDLAVVEDVDNQMVV